MLIALIDATGHTAKAPPDLVVAGLGLVERAIRLVAVAGCQRALVATTARWAEAVRAEADAVEGFDVEVAVREVEGERITTVLAAVGDELGALLGDDPGADDRLIYVRSTTVYDRGLVNEPRDAATAGAVGTLDASGKPADVLAVAGDAVEATLDCARACDAGDVAGLLAALEASPCQLRQLELDKWQVRVADASSADRAAGRLWDSCRKPLDGIVSRHLNRHISLSISRTIAHTGVTPNHVSIVTFSLGLIAAIFAGLGGYAWFLLAGITYQLNSIIDGVDGELARVKYEFSVLGEWLDTLSDDTKDVLFYAGLGVGAWRTVPSPTEAVGAELWLWLGGVAVGGKLLSMVGYYTWLIARGRGDLLAFEWSFEDDAAEPSALARFLAGFKYLTKNDFIVFFAMCVAIAGVLPWFLFVVAPGQVIIAISVVIQRLSARPVA